MDVTRAGSLFKHVSCLGRIFLFLMLLSLPKRSTTSTPLHLLSENSGNVFRGNLERPFVLSSISCHLFSECNVYFLLFYQLVKDRQRMPTQRTSLALVLPKPWSLTTPVKAKKTASGIVAIVIIRVQIIQWTVKKKNANRPRILQRSSRVGLRWTLPTLNPDCRTPACPACPLKNTRPILTFCRVKNQGFLHRY